jgi:ketosteroid isomerase-like protein
MPDTDLQTVREFYEAYGRLEFPAELLDPEIEYVNPPGAIEPGVRRGIDAFAQAVRGVSDGWESWSMELERLTQVEDQVAAVISYEARGRSSGVEFRGRESALFTLRAGKIVRYEWFHGPDDAAEAARQRS